MVLPGGQIQTQSPSKFTIWTSRTCLNQKYKSHMLNFSDTQTSGPSVNGGSLPSSSFSSIITWYELKCKHRFTNISHSVFSLGQTPSPQGQTPPGMVIPSGSIGVPSGSRVTQGSPAPPQQSGSGLEVPSGSIGVPSGSGVTRATPATSRPEINGGPSAPGGPIGSSMG